MQWSFDRNKSDCNAKMQTTYKDNIKFSVIVVFDVSTATRFDENMENKKPTINRNYFTYILA